MFYYFVFFGYFLFVFFFLKIGENVKCVKIFAAFQNIMKAKEKILGGATTLSITTLSIRTLSITNKPNATFSIMALSIMQSIVTHRVAYAEGHIQALNVEFHCAEWHYSERRYA
jgi:hypothetical protein